MSCVLSGAPAGSVAGTRSPGRWGPARHRRRGGGARACMAALCARVAASASLKARLEATRARRWRLGLKLPGLSPNSSKPEEKKNQCQRLWAHMRYGATVAPAPRPWLRRRPPQWNDTRANASFTTGCCRTAAGVRACFLLLVALFNWPAAQAAASRRGGGRACCVRHIYCD